MAKIDAFFQLMHDQGASDLHLVTGQQPIIRIRGDIERVRYNVLDNDELKGMIYEIAPEHKVKQFEETGDVAHREPVLASDLPIDGKQTADIDALEARVTTVEKGLKP